MVNDLKLERLVEELVLGTTPNSKNEKETMAEIFKLIDMKKALILEILAAGNMEDLLRLLIGYSEILRVESEGKEKKLRSLEAENGR